MSGRTPARTAPALVTALPRAALALPTHLRRRLVMLALVVAVLGVAYLAWFRDSSFVRVERVTVTGLATPQAGHLREVLTRSALGMTTLHVDEDVLRRAVGGNPLVRTIQAIPSFPHALRVVVGLGVPVAALAGSGRTVAVAADGTLLPDLTVRALPVITLSRSASGARLGRGAALDLVTIAAAAPPALRGGIDSISNVAGEGVVARLRQGPAVVLGDVHGLYAKWAAASAVLAAQSSRGATYVDVRVPGQPVAGGLSLSNRPQTLPSAGTAGGIGPTTIPATPSSDATGQGAIGAGPVRASGGASSATVKPQP